VWKFSNGPFCAVLILQATQFFEFLGATAQAGTVGQAVHLPSAYMQPIAADDVADELVAVCLNAPINGTIEIAGPERVRLSEMVERYLKSTNDERHVVAEEGALYFGLKLNDKSLVPGANGRLSPTSFDEWFRQMAPEKN
jgi:uncharacterized protein YbjT (DUF2867 family)